MKRRMKLKWTNKKPNFPCVFLCRSKIRDTWHYTLFRFKKVEDEDCWYLGWFNEDGEEFGPIEDMVADEYLVIERLR